MDQMETLPFELQEPHIHPADWKPIVIEEKGCEFQSNLSNNLSSAEMVETSKTNHDVQVLFKIVQVHLMFMYHHVSLIHTGSSLCSLLSSALPLQDSPAEAKTKPDTADGASSSATPAVEDGKQKLLTCQACFGQKIIHP